MFQLLVPQKNQENMVHSDLVHLGTCQIVPLLVYTLLQRLDHLPPSDVSIVSPA